MKPHSRTWQGQASKDAATLQDLLDCCHVNIRDAARLEAELRDLRRRLRPDDPRVTGTAETPPIGYQIVKAHIEQGHWREYQRYYLQRIAVEGRDAVVPIPLPKDRPRPPAAPPQVDPRLPREPGADDGDEAPF